MLFYYKISQLSTFFIATLFVPAQAQAAENDSLRIKNKLLSGISIAFQCPKVTIGG